MTEETRVLYNAECPVCSFEINHYASYAKDRDLPLRFDDLNSDALAAWGLDEDIAARRLYLQKGDMLLSGIPAFIVLWQEMPRYRWLARLVNVPGIHRLAVWGYDLVLAPIIYRWHRSRKAASTKS
jgi:predicted DCC family thiol-disulfide oxidoreductase YuxK